MAKESFLLLSLSDNKAKKIAQAVNNESCRKILDYLSTVKDASETKIAEELKIPLPTVHYNLKQLVDVKLVDIDEFHYSQKGKEINHYSLANKYIIIAPKEDLGFLDKLKKILPAFGIITATSLIIKFVQTGFFKASTSEKLMAASENVALDAAPSLMMARTAEAAPQIISTPSFATWFFIGGCSALLIYLVVEMIRKK